jgi:hypothetical protein
MDFSSDVKIGGGRRMERTGVSIKNQKIQLVENFWAGAAFRSPAPGWIWPKNGAEKV